MIYHEMIYAHSFILLGCRQRVSDHNLSRFFAFTCIMGKQIRAREAVKEALPPLLRTEFHTYANALHPLLYRGELHYWPDFRQDVGAATNGQQWGNSVIKLMHFPGFPLIGLSDIRPARNMIFQARKSWRRTGECARFSMPLPWGGHRKMQAGLGGSERLSVCFH